MKTANLTIVPSLFFINGITASLIAPKEIKHYSFDLICFSKTKITTTVTSATSQFQGLGVLWYNSFNALSGITLPNELHRIKSHIIWNISIISLVEYFHPYVLLTSNPHSLWPQTAFRLAKKKMKSWIFRQWEGFLISWTMYLICYLNCLFKISV